MSAHSAACITHLRHLSETGELPDAASVFFGGGTPSLLPAEQLVRILASIPRLEGAEVTVECNPDNSSPELFEAYLSGGVNRISFGVQSMVDKVLLSLGRHHDRSNVERSVAWAREAGFQSLNLDLIYGGAGESLADWSETIEAVIELDPPHVSAYALTIEAGTPLASDTSRHPDDDDLADKYLLATERFAAAGLVNYEISNWAKPGFECQHNWLYWMQGNYAGVGCAAHSHRDGHRWWNLRTPERYVEAAGNDKAFTATGEQLSDDVRALEGLQLMLRTRFGVPLRHLSRKDLEELDHLLEVRGDRIVLTPEGRLLANEVANRLIVIPQGATDDYLTIT